MASISVGNSLGYLIWDSRKGLNCNPNVLRPIQFSPNFRPASLVPKQIGTQTVWELYDDGETSNTTWGSYDSGQRNGIALTTSDGVVQLWDVRGYPGSDEPTSDSPHAKLEAFANLVCEECDENANTLAGQYCAINGCTFPSYSSATTLCYTFTRTDNGDAQAASLVEMYYANYLIGAVTFVSRTAGVTTWKIGLNKAYTLIGQSTLDTNWTLVAC